jgi:hypothetical protein
MISDYGRSNPTAISYDYSSKVIFGDHATTGGVQSGGQGDTQHVQQLIGEDARSDMAAQLDRLIELADELPDDTPGVEGVRQALTGLSTEVAKPQAVREWLGKALGAAAPAVGTSGGQQLIEGLGHLMRMLGS